MARTGTAEDHQAGQAALVSTIADLIAHIWDRLLDPHDLKGSTPKIVAAIQAIVQHYGRASSTAALTYYRTERRAAGITTPFRPQMPPLPSADEITAVVEHALSPVYGPPDAQVMQNAEAALASEVEQLVLNQSRDTIIGAVAADKEAKGWARVTEPGACSFCRLLATRGAVYKSEASAGFAAHSKQPNGSGGDCRCHAEPVFNAFEPTAEARQDLADYRDLTKKYGKSGRPILIAWRQHVEGRPVTGPLTKPYTRRNA